EDVTAIVEMVYELAEFEKAVEECHLTPEKLRVALFGPAPSVICHVARVDGQAIGMALWFRTFSTWTGVQRASLEGLYVRPVARLSGGVTHRDGGSGRAPAVHPRLDRRPAHRRRRGLRDAARGGQRDAAARRHGRACLPVHGHRRRADGGDDGAAGLPDRAAA